MPTLQFVAGIVIAIGAVVIFFGALSGAACSGGPALVDFGIGAILVGVGIALLGATPVVIPMSILGVVLLAVGWHFGQVAGCY